MKKLFYLIILILTLAACSSVGEISNSSQPTTDVLEAMPVSTEEIETPPAITIIPTFTLRPSATPTKTKAPTLTPTVQTKVLSAGDYILFETGFPGILYARSLVEGEVFQLFNGSLRFSSNGQYMVLGVYNPYLIDLYTFEEKLGRIPKECGQFSSFAPNGDWAAVSCGGAMSLVSLFSDQMINLTDWEPFTPDTDYLFPEWSPDGSKIAYVVHVGAFSPNEEYANGVYIASIDCYPDFEDCTVTTTGPFLSEHRMMNYLAWSSDGQRLAAASYHENNMIYIINMSAMAVGQKIEIPEGDVHSLAWSPDGEYIAFEAHDKINILSLSDLTITEIFHALTHYGAGIQGWYTYDKLGIID